MQNAAKDSAELSNQEIARTWHAGIDLTFAGVNLADCMTYDVLSVLGRAWLSDANKQALEAQKVNDPTHV